MSIKFKTLTKAEFPYIDDGDIDSLRGIMYGKNASIDLVCVNPNQVPTDSSVIAVFSLPELTKNVGTVYVKIDDVWKRRLTSSFSADYANGLLSIPNCRAANGQTYEVKLVDCYGYMAASPTNHSYPRQVLEHFFANYGGIAYTESNFDKAKWESELDHADVQADIGFLLNDNGQNVWDVVFEISRKSKSYFRVDYDNTGRIYAKRIDHARVSSGVVSSCEIRNASSLSVSSLRDGVFSSVLTKFFYNSSADTWLSVRNNTYENEVRQSYRKEQELEEETFLVNSADAKVRAYKHATKFADIQHTVELELYEYLDLDLYDVLTVALMPDNLSASARVFAGNKDCLVIATNPNAKERINYVTVQIIPDRVPSVSQEAVVADTFEVVERPKSIIEIVQEETVAMANVDSYLTNPSITLFTDEAGAVESYADAVGVMRVLAAGTDVTASAIFSVEYKPDAVEVTISAAGEYSVTASTVDTAVVVFAAEYGGVKITKSLTINKRLRGTTVVPVTLIPDDVSSVTAVAEKDGIAIRWAWTGAGLKNSLKRYRVEISDDNFATWLTFYCTANEYFYAFNRDTDGYPSSTDLSSWRVRVKAENMYNNESVLYISQSVTTTAYVGWNPSAPAVSTTENGRGPTIGWSDAAAWYGAGAHDIQIAKGYTVVGGVPELITNLGTLTAYAPAVGLNPRDSYDNFKSGSADGFLTRAGTTLALSLPLYGQNEADAVCYDTPYYVRVRSSTNVPTSADPSARLTSEWSAWNLVYARGTVQDLVKNAIKTGHISDYSITANKILVEMLSALTANIGVITDGAFVGSENNRWALSRVYAEDGTTVLRYEGAMRVGGADQYLEVKPVVVDGVVTDYTIDFKVGTFTVTATGSTINGDFVVKSLDGATTWMTINKTTGAVLIAGNLVVSGQITGNASSAARLAIGVCATAQATVAKVVSLPGFSLTKGAKVCVIFLYGAAANATLNVESTGAKTIYSDGAVTNTGTWSANDIVDFIYDGTYWNVTAVNGKDVRATASDIATDAIEAAFAVTAANLMYGTCSTAAGTTAKTSAIPNFRLTIGAKILLTCTNQTMLAGATLNVNGTGARPIKNGGGYLGAVWAANSINEFVYDGTYWLHIAELNNATGISQWIGWANEAAHANAAGKIDGQSAAALLASKRIVCFEFANTATYAAVYTALSPLMNPVVGSHTATIGRFGDVQWVSILKRNASSGIQIFNSQSQSVAGFNNGDTNQIGSDFQIAFIIYVNV